MYYIIIGKPIVAPWYIFCKEEHEWKDEEKISFTQMKDIYPK